MPLTKRPQQTDVAQPSAATQGATASLPAQSSATVGTKTRASKDSAPMTKDGYWERKEMRDIRTGECIRLSGVLQALLSSVNYGQYCTTSDKASYLAEVKKDAKELAKFITEEA